MRQLISPVCTIGYNGQRIAPVESDLLSRISTAFAKAVLWIATFFSQTAKKLWVAAKAERALFDQEKSLYHWGLTRSQSPWVYEDAIKSLLATCEFSEKPKTVLKQINRLCEEGFFSASLNQIQMQLHQSISDYRDALRARISGVWNLAFPDRTYSVAQKRLEIDIRALREIYSPSQCGG